MKSTNNNHKHSDSRRAIGLFATTHFFPCLVALINSLFYNNVKAAIKVYDYGGMNHLLRSYLQRYVSVIDVGDPLLNDDGMFLYAWNWRPRITRNYIEGIELFLDADIVILNDLEEVFAYLEQGYFVGSPEFTYQYDKDEAQYLKDGQGWQKIIGTTSFVKEFDIYNAGFYGFNRHYHEHLLELWDCSSRVRQFHENEPFYWEQWTFSLILEHERKQNRVKIKSLPKHLWMNTWDNHAEPQKHLAFRDGKICLLDANTNEPLGLYHYTGFPGFTDGDIRGKLYHATKEDILNNSALDKEDESVCLKKQWYELWEMRFNSPAALLYDYMYQLGPLRTPATFSLDFRKKAAHIINRVFNRQDIDHNSKEAFAICIAYDYLDLLGYGLTHAGWMEIPLKLLCDTDFSGGAQTISWDHAESDVALSFSPPCRDGNSWITSSFGRRTIEHVNGLNIVINA